MFADHTSAAIIALAYTDKGVTPGEINRLSAILSSCAGHSSAVADDCPFVTYGRAAKMLNLSLPTIKRLVKRGRLQPVIGTGRRAIGIRRKSIEDMVG